MRTRAKTDRSNYLFDNHALAALIIPLVIEQLLAILVGMADSIMIANVGEAAVSGVSLVDQVMILVIQIFSALATGGAVVAGQYLGQKNQKKACESAMQMVWFITLCAGVIMIGVYIGKYWILHGVFGQIDSEVRKHANTYLLIVTASIPFIALYNCGFPYDGQFRGIHADIGNHECDKCGRECIADLWISPRGRGRCNSYSDIPRCSGSDYYSEAPESRECGAH